jgi:hypothetical protein
MIDTIPDPVLLFFERSVKAKPQSATMINLKGKSNHSRNRVCVQVRAGLAEYPVGAFIVGVAQRTAARRGNTR